MNTQKRTRQDNNGESSSDQTKKTPSPLTEAVRRFHGTLNNIEEEIDESYAWCESDNEKIRILSVRQHIRKLREAAIELVKANGGVLGCRESHEVQSAGHHTAKNIWFNIGLSPIETAAVRKIRSWSCAKGKKAPLSRFVRALLISSLAHYGVISRLFCNDQTYATSEGFIETQNYQEGIIKKAFRLKCVGSDKWG